MSKINIPRNVLIILGMHRSGTSLVSGWLSKCGLNLGDRILGGAASNKNGHFEDLDFLDLHEEILSYYQIITTGLVPPFDFELDMYYYKKLKSNIAFKNSLHKQWGWKEPRTCLFMDYYRELIPKAKYLVVYRDYPFVVDSLIRRDNMFAEMRFKDMIKNQQAVQIMNEQTAERTTAQINNYLTVWTIYNQKILDLLNSINKDDYIIIQYDKLVENDEAVYKKIAEWNFNLIYHSFSAVFDPALINEKKPDTKFDPHIEEQAVIVKNKMLALLNNNLKIN